MQAQREGRGTRLRFASLHSSSGTATMAGDKGHPGTQPGSGGKLGRDVGSARSS